MPYEKTEWKDHIVEYPNRYRQVQNPDGTITLSKDPGNVVQQGTPLSAANLNKMEQGIYDAHDKIGILNKKTDGIVNVKEFGAKGDGVTDDTAAIQNAINSLTNGGDVIFPYTPASYLISNSLTLKNNIRLIGLGRRPKIKSNGSITTYIINGLNCSNCIIQNLDLDMNKVTNTAGTTFGIYLKNSNNVTIQDCTIQKIEGDGIYIADSANILVKDNLIDDINRNGITTTGDIDNVIIQNNKLTNMRFGGLISEDDDDYQFVKNLHYLNNRVYGVAGAQTGMAFTSGLSNTTVKKYQNCSMIGNYIDGFFLGITARLSEDVTISRNQLVNVERGIHINAYSTTESKNIKIINNSIKVSSASNNIAISLFNVIEGIIHGNLIYNATGNAIYAYTLSDSTISNNIVNKTTMAKAIVVRGGVKNCKIIDNTIIDAYLTAIQVQAETANDPLYVVITGNIAYRTGTGVDMRYGIEFVNSPTKCIVKNNDVERVSTTSLYNVGTTGNIVADNFVK